MALQAVTPDAVLTIPGAYGTYKVQTNPQGLATSGILILMGEADQGADYGSESTLADTFFGPDEVARAATKFGAGQLVDAMRIASAAANDPDIQGAPQGFYLLKTNVAGKASLALSRAGIGAYGSLYDRNYGEPGNLIEESIAEVVPYVTFAYLPIPDMASDDSAVSLRVNGGAVQSLSNIAKQSLASAVVGSVVSGSATGLNSLTDILATGGVDRGVIAGFGPTHILTLTVVSGNNVTITLGGTGTAWATTPSVGDVLVIPDAATYGVTNQSTIAGGAGQNLGTYIVTAATSTVISATKLRDATALTVSAPTGVSMGVGADQADIIVWSPVTIKNMSGTSRAILASANVGANITGTASGSTLTLTLGTGTWAALPQVGDYVYMPSTAPAAWHASGANGGYYTVTAATTTTMTLTRLSNGNPASFAATAIAATSDLVCKRPAIDGAGKSLEIFDGGDDVSIANSFRTLSGAAVTWLSTTGSPVLNVSSSELEVELTTARQSQSLSEDITAGGEIVLLIGYTGTTATVTIGTSTLTTSVVGGSGANLSINLRQYQTIGDLAAFINSQTGYTASASSNLSAQYKLWGGTKDAPLLTLDKGTFSIGTSHGNQPGRIKRDAWEFYSAVADESLLVQLGSTPAPATAGLPDAQALSFLAGGTRGATTDADVVAALAAAEKLRANFVIPLFSQDAASDYTDGLTDSASTYTIDAINAATKTHALRMSQFKTRRNRIALVSKAGTFNEARDAANSMASFRVLMAFQKFKAQASDGSIQTFQPWAGAVYAAAMQAAGGYRSIMNKGINTSGVLSWDSSFDAESDTQVETALLDGLLVARTRETGGVAWVSDQTTYAIDSNFVYNSMQAVYAADLVTLTVAQRMERAFVGQSLADVSAASAAGVFAAIMADLKRLKYLASSDDAPGGFKNARFRVQGNVLFVSAEIKIANALAFVPINFVISEVQQTASI
jgi:predicted 3-demethylubiquinone-9 3-methyltransferase (glyoxalase superfamily)